MKNKHKPNTKRHRRKLLARTLEEQARTESDIIKQKEMMRRVNVMRLLRG